MAFGQKYSRSKQELSGHGFSCNAAVAGFPVGRRLTSCFLSGINRTLLIFSSHVVSRNTGTTGEFTSSAPALAEATAGAECFCSWDGGGGIVQIGVREVSATGRNPEHSCDCENTQNIFSVELSPVITCIHTGLRTTCLLSMPPFFVLTMQSEG